MQVSVFSPFKIIPTPVMYLKVFGTSIKTTVLRSQLLKIQSWQIQTRLPPHPHGLEIVSGWLGMGHAGTHTCITLCPETSDEHLLPAWPPFQLPPLHLGVNHLKDHSPANYNTLTKRKSWICLVAQRIELTCSLDLFLNHKQFSVCLKKNKGCFSEKWEGGQFCLRSFWFPKKH